LGYAGVIRNRANGDRGRLLEQHEERHLLHAGALLQRGGAAARMAAAAADPDACCEPQSRPSLPSQYTYLNFGKIKDKGSSLA
jgi:hypothetical protein